MTRLEKFLLGGAGALLPILLTVAISDGVKIASYVDNEPMSLVGYLFRAMALFVIGAVWVYVDGSITTKRKAVEIGIVAPALLSTIISASNVTYARNGEQDSSVNFGIVSRAYAQDVPKPPQEPKPVDQFIKGILGR